MTTGKYAYLLEQVEADLNTTKEKKVKEALEMRLKVLDKLKDAVEDLEKEVKQLLKDGKITDLSTMIKVDAGENEGTTAPIVINKEEGVMEKSTGIYVKVN